MSTIIDITNTSPRQTSTSTSTSRRSPVPTTNHHDTHSDTESDSDADWVTRYGKGRQPTDTDTDADGVKKVDKHDTATKPITTDSEDEHESKHALLSKVDIVQPVTAPLLHKTSALSFPDDNSVKRQPSIGVLQPVPQQSISQRSNALLSCILLFLVIFQLMIGMMGLLLTISSWNVHCDYPLQFLSLAISVVFLAFGCVLAAYMCLVTAEQATKAFATLFCLLYFAGVPLFWVGLYWLHRSTTCDANLTEQLYQLYSPLFMVPWLVMLSSIVVIPVMLYYGCRSLTSRMNDEKTDVV